MKKFKLPFRVGKKQKRAVLDADGLEVVVFPKGFHREAMAQRFVKIMNLDFEIEID